jgi:hypothetical protein
MALAAQAVLPQEAKDNRVRNGKPHLRSAAAAAVAGDQSLSPAETAAFTALEVAAVKWAEELDQTASSL